MKFYEILWRKIELKLFKKHYCDNNTRHGHHLEFVRDSKNHPYYYWTLFQCSVCKKYLISDYSGLQYADEFTIKCLVN